MKRWLVTLSAALLVAAMTVAVCADPIHVGGGPMMMSSPIHVGGGPMLSSSPIHVGGGPMTALGKSANGNAYGLKKNLGIQPLSSPIHVGGGPTATLLSSPIHVGGGPT